ncbi:hypothetical protein ACP70R_036884 [Stipagrostis hirtigluma subsp. patula]
MEPEADKAASPAPAAAVEASDDAIQEESPAPAPAQDRKAGSGAAAAPEVEVQLFRRGRGPVAVFRTRLGGYTQDQLEVGDILEQYGLKSVFAFNPAARTRGVAIRFHPRNGRSLLTYAPGTTIFLDGEPKKSDVADADYIEYLQSVGKLGATGEGVKEAVEETNPAGGVRQVEQRNRRSVASPEAAGEELREQLSALVAILVAILGVGKEVVWLLKAIVGVCVLVLFGIVLSICLQLKN